MLVDGLQVIAHRIVIDRRCIGRCVEWLRRGVTTDANVAGRACRRDIEVATGVASGL